MSFLLGLFTSAKRWVYGIGAVILLVAGAWYLGRRKGKNTAEAAAHDEAVAHDAQQRAVTAEQVAEHIQTKEQVHDQVQSMPAPAVDPAPVGSAPAGSAAAELRDHWSRQAVPPAK